MTAKVGELRRVAFVRTASLRHAKQRSVIDLTVWYPARADALERPVVIGPSDRPLFRVGSAAPAAAFAGRRRRPVILLSHGFGGSARMMGWFGIGLARKGYVVLAVDHPGSNGIDEMTMAGALLWWERAEDLRAALAQAAGDPAIEPHLDLHTVGVAGFSAGGFTALVAAGARADRDRFERFCAANPEDGVCQPQREFPVTAAEREAAFTLPEMRAEAARAREDHSIANVRAAFAIAPALVQALDPESLASLSRPVELLVGDADTVAPAATNGMVASLAIPSARVVHLRGVGHYDFLAEWTEAGSAAFPWCSANVPQRDTHRLALDAAAAFFRRQLGTAQPPAANGQARCSSDAH